MRILVLGANGFIGSAFIELLRTLNVEVRALVRRNLNADHDFIELRVGDLTDKNLNFEKLLEGCDVIVNCAGEVKNPSLMQALHVKATTDLLKAANNLCIAGNLIHWVQLSSVGAYGSSKEERVVTEATPTNPVGDYEVTKTLADTIIMNNKTAGFSYTILRPSNVFGRNMTNNSLRQLGNMVKKKVFFFIGYSPAIATYVHVDDVATALYLCATKAHAKGHVFNISNDCTLKEFIAGMANALDVPVPKIIVPEYLARCVLGLASMILPIPITQNRIDALVRRTTYPSDKMHRVLGFSPEKSVPKTICEIF
ncbi:NAD(P)-dependent oxidoreductase [Pseudomonas sp. EYE_354]|uniref:NAD-dependent epimerase/dehydratase family protein n=1 Tax=Pseudomonas sp. EYE_354 TaxID=2853449 RepID=UPI002003F943|nr:NAD(P)-dependent oxidoreductase [Pseudomonas sp. EYE_354]MCK6186792.1 NAD(P)-dependent oxidoreductase [Pseudomonas sp. EYE_354]